MNFYVKIVCHRKFSQIGLSNDLLPDTSACLSDTRQNRHMGVNGYSQMTRNANASLYFSRKAAPSTVVEEEKGNRYFLQPIVWLWSLVKFVTEFLLLNSHNSHPAKARLDQILVFCHALERTDKLNTQL